MNQNPLLEAERNFLSDDYRLSESDQQNLKSIYGNIPVMEKQQALQFTYKKLLLISHLRLKQKQKIFIQYPVNDKINIKFKVSLIKCQHPDRCMDFLQIFYLFKYNQMKEFECSVCSNKFIIDDGKNPNWIQNLYVEPCFKFTYKKIHSTHQQVDLYEDKPNYYMHPTYNFQGINKTVFTNSQKDIFRFFRKQIDGKNDFFQFVQQNKNNEDFQAVCLMNFTKLCLPVRFKDCKHLEVYDLMNLIIQCDRCSQEKEKPTFKCKYPSCQCKITLDKEKILSEFGLDKQLLSALLQGVSFSTKFKIDLKKRTVLDSLASSNKDQIISKLYQFPPFELIQSIWEKTSLVVAKGMTKDLNISQENELLIELDIDMKDKYSGLLIEIPSRCIKCPDRKYVMELRSMIFIIQQKQNEDTEADVKCPLCNQVFANQPYNSLQIDYQLQRFTFIQQKELQTNPYLRIFGKEYVKENFFMGKKITLDDFLLEESVQASKKISFPETICQISKKKLKFPLIYGDCKHNYYFDLDSIYDEYKKDKFKTLKLCGNCVQYESQTQYIRISDFTFNECLHQMIEKVPNLKSILYDINTKKISGEGNIQIQVIPQPKVNFSDLIELLPATKQLYGKKSLNGFNYNVLSSSYGQNIVKITENGIDASQLAQKSQQVENDLLKNFGFSIKVKSVNLGGNQVINLQKQPPPNQNLDIQNQSQQLVQIREEQKTQLPQPPQVVQQITNNQISQPIQQQSTSQNNQITNEPNQKRSEKQKKIKILTSPSPILNESQQKKNQSADNFPQNQQLQNNSSKNNFKQNIIQTYQIPIINKIKDKYQLTNTLLFRVKII